MKFHISRTIVALLASIYFVWCAYNFSENGNFIHTINFPIHEAGHIIFSPLGEFITVAGGSILQTIVPIFFCIYFFYRQELFSLFLTLFWVGSNFFDMATYADDAVFTELPLWSMGGNEDTIIHDWNYMLTKTNLLHQTDLVVLILYGIGAVITIAAVIGSFYYANSEDSQSDMGNRF